jgi:hypothetical protein
MHVFSRWQQSIVPRRLTCRRIKTCTFFWNYPPCLPRGHSAEFLLSFLLQWREKSRRFASERLVVDNEASVIPMHTELGALRN